MKNYDRVLAMLLAVLLLIGAMTAYAEGDVDLVVSQDIEVPQDIDGLDLDIGVPDLDISPEAFELSDDLSLVEEAPEAATVVSNADEETSTVYHESFTMEVGDQRKVHNHVRTYYSLIITDTSSDPNVARISSGGIITAVTAGKCVITVTAVHRWGGGLPRVWEYDVTVVGGPVLSETEKTLRINETFQLNVSNLGKRSVRSWSSSNPEVATVDNGMVTAVGEGTCVISAGISNGGFLRCSVEVKGSEGLTSNNVRLKLRKLKTVRLKDRILRKVSWSCSDPSIVRIKTKGSICLIRALRKGECTVTARVKGGQTYTCRVVVE